MNQIIAPKAINFNELVKNSNTTLSLNIQTKMIDKLSTEFTNEEQQWYVANLYMYMNYHPTNDYPINLEDVFKMIGFANKGNAMKTIKSNFTEGEDYKMSFFRSENRTKEGGKDNQNVMLNIDTFKNLCMLAKTAKGKDIRKYYVKLENIYNQIIKEEIEEKETLLQDQQKKLEFYEQKPVTHGFLSRRSGYVYLLQERSTSYHYKIGMTYDVDKRLRNLNTSSSGKTIRIYNEVKSYDCELLEMMIHKLLKPFNIVGRREWFYFDNKQAECALYMLHKANDFLNDYNHASLEEFSQFFNIDKLEYLKDKLVNEIEDLKNTQDTKKSSITSKIKRKQDTINSINARIKGEDVKVNTKQVDTPIIKETNVFKLTGQQFKNITGNYKGVFWIKEKKKWRGEIKMHYKSIFLGYFDSELEGAKAYNDYALFINNRDNTNYELNDIKDYVPNPRDIPEENKEELDENKTSNYNGVSYYSKRKYYVAGIKYKGKSYGLGKHENEIECAKLYNQQALYFNQEFNTNYILNEIDDYITQPKNIYQAIQDKKSERKTSKYYGVTFSKKNNKFRVVLVHNKKQIHIGFFENEKDAAKAYNQKALELNMSHKTNYNINLIE